MLCKLENINKSNKLAVYARVSTSQQDINKQVEIGLELAATLGFEKQKVKIIKDHGVSSMQVKLEDRLGMTELLRIIKNKQIDTLIVFDRDRLARNMVEYLVIVAQAINYDVKIIFSNSEAEPFTNKLDREADLALYAEMEGKKINQRTAAVRKYYPPTPFGYQKIGKRSDTQYMQNINDIEKVNTMFEEFESIKNKSDFIQFKKRWEIQKGIDCKKILTNPFYAGVIIHTNESIEPLNHIKGIVRKETILENRQKINAWGYNKKRVSASDTYFNNLGISVICGECKRSLNFSRKNDEICLSCNHGKNGQKVVSCSVSQLKQILQNHVKKVIELLDIELLEKTTNAKITEHMQQKRQQLRKVENERVKAIKKLGRLSHSTTIIDIMQTVQEFDRQIKLLTLQIDKLESVRGKLNEFVNILNSEFQRYFPQELNEVTRILVKEIIVGKDYVDVQTRASDCLNKVI